MYRVIDVSSNNGVLDWDKIKQSGVDGAIIRIGYGSDIESQDDSQAVRNMQECERIGMPYGTYIYSYALTAAEVDSEIAHTFRMIRDFQPTLGVWFDMEDSDGYKAQRGYPLADNGEMYTDFCIQYMEAMREGGYKTGVYANYNNFVNVLDDEKLTAFDGFHRWVARWGALEPGLECLLWQYTSDGAVDGSSARTDMNIYYGELKQDETAGDERIDIEYQVQLRSGRWLPVVVNEEDYAGLENEEIIGIAITTSKGYCLYQAHDENGWHANIDSRNTDIEDYINGYAGAMQPIDALRVYYYTPEDYAQTYGYKRAKYRVSPIGWDGYYPYQYDNETVNGQDGYAGVYGVKVDKVQMIIE